MGKPLHQMTLSATPTNQDGLGPPFQRDESVYRSASKELLAQSAVTNDRFKGANRHVIAFGMIGNCNEPHLAPGRSTVNLVAS